MRLDDVLKEFGSTTETTVKEDPKVETKPTETVETKPTELDDKTEKKVDETKPGETKPDETKLDETKLDETKPKVEQEVKKRSHAEQEQYAWHKKNEEVKALRDKITRLAEENKKLRVNKPVDRNNYKTDEEYYDAKMNSKLDERMASQNDEEQKRLNEELEKAEYDAESNRARDLLSKTYSDPKELEQYNTAISAANQAGLGKVLTETESGQDFVNFCKHSDLAPRLYYHIAMSPKDLVNFIDDPDHASRMAKLNYLENSLRQAFSKKSETKVEKNPVVPILGKIGSGGTPDGLENDHDLKLKLRRMR